MNFSPAIVVIAYNRPDCLKRLLRTVLEAHYSSDNIPLIISIDHSECSEVLKIAEDWKWSFGAKRIIKHRQHLGLKKHILQSCALAIDFGAVIILEDDLIFSRFYYQFDL